MSERLKELASTLGELKRRETENKLAHYQPYEFQRQLHALGAKVHERAALAANQVGKSSASAFEVAYHLTGLHPDWWEGLRFDRPIRAWACSVTSEATRDNIQRLLLGPIGHEGEGAIPKNLIEKIITGRGIPNAVDTVLVKHKSGGTSQLSFKSYERGREKFQGETLDFIAMDEEPDEDVYSECLARLVAKKGSLLLTATPLKGVSNVVFRFTDDPNPDRAYIQAGLEDAGHFDAAERARIAANYPAHEREARTRGVPMMGKGRIFQTPEDDILVYQREITPLSHWAHVCAVDFGISHPFAWAHLAWDRDTDTIYVLESFRMKDVGAAEHVAEISKRNCSRILHVFPHDGLSRDKGSGQALRSIYAGMGINMHSTNVTDKDGGTSVWGGIVEMQDRFETQRLKIVAETNPAFLDEYRMYHMKDNMPVKERDDVISAVRYGVMGIRFARPVTNPRRKKTSGRIAPGTDFNLLG